MERHRTLDSSMSSLYSGSNVSQTPSRQLEPYSSSTNLQPVAYHNQYATSSSAAPSPTPSSMYQQQLQQQLQLQQQQHMQLQRLNSTASGQTVNSVASTGAGSATSSGGLRATTIGTVVVRCGPIQLVIALLQVSVFFLYYLNNKRRSLDYFVGVFFLVF